MSDPLDIWRQVATNWTAVLDCVGDDQWTEPTPCAEWNVRQLVDHTLAWQAQGGRLLGADIGPDADWPAIRAAYDALLSDLSQLSGTVPSSRGSPSPSWPGS